MKYLFKALPWLLLVLPAILWAETAPTYDRASLSVAAEREVDNDTMTAQLFSQQQGNNTAAMADAVNKTIAWAVAEARKHDAIKVSTDAYSTTPVYNKGTVAGWQVRQSIGLESQDMALLSELIGTLQSRLSLGGIGFTVSREKRKQVEDELISEALSAFKQRATLIASKLDHSGYRLVDVNVGTSGSRPVYMSRNLKMEAMTMSADVAAPAMEAGEATLSVNVNGSIELR